MTALLEKRETVLKDLGRKSDAVLRRERTIFPPLFFSVEKTRVVKVSFQLAEFRGQKAYIVVD